MAATSAIARRAFVDVRVRTGVFALLFTLVALAVAAGYRHSYPTLAERSAFARSFGANKTLQLFYGVPHDLLTVGGYTAWRLAGFGSLFAAVWGLLAAVRVLRAEEDAGRRELVLAGAVTRRAAYIAVLAALALAGVILWLATLVGLVLAHLPVGGSAFLALVTVSPIPVFAGVGALASQLASTRRLALELASGALVVAFLVRVVADTSTGLDWLRWATPLGWVEQLRPFTGPRPAVILLPFFAGLLLLLAAGLVASDRDVGLGLLRGRDSAATPRLRLLSSTTAHAIRSELGSLTAWLAGIGVFALIVGLLSTSFTSANIPASLQEQLRKLGGASIITPSGAIGFYFLFFVLVISLFGCAQIAAIRREEADQRLETLFALPVGRRSWLAGRLVLAAVGAALLALAVGVLAWAGATSQGADVSLADLLEAGGNCLPAAFLFLSVGALAFALLPRASSGIAYGLVSASFVWELFGSLLGAPSWLLDLTPFRHLGLVPAQPFRVVAATSMLAISTAAALVSLWLFSRRDLAGA